MIVPPLLQSQVTGLTTADSPQFTAVNIGHASDTTLARVSAGVASIAGKNIALNGTGETLTTGTIELGAAADTTIARVGAGQISVEGVNIVTTSSTDTLTNKTLTNHSEGAEDTITSGAPDNADLSVRTSNNVTISGTTTITSFGTVAAGTIVHGRFSGALTLTHNATSLILPNAGNNITTEAGDSFIAESLGSGNWKILSYQKSNGEALVGGAGGGTKTYAVFTPLHNQPPASNYATFDTRNSIAVLDFDAGATDEVAVFVGIMPEAASLGSGLKVRIHWMCTETSGNVRWGVAFERMNTDEDSDSFDTAAEANGTANGTSGIITVTEITQTNIDGITAGDGYRLKVYRESSDTGNDTMASDAELVCVEVRSAA